MTITGVSIEEIGKSIREMTEEAARTAMEAVETAIRQANEAAEVARLACEKASMRADEISKSARETAEEAARTAKEAAESAIRDATEAVGAARAASEKASIRAEEAGRRAKELAAEVEREARQATEAAIKQANEAAEAARAMLQQATNRADEISDFARQMAEETARAAREAAEAAKVAFQEAFARGIAKSDEARKAREAEQRKRTGVEDLGTSESAAVRPQPQERTKTTTEEAPTSLPWMTSMGNSVRNPLRKSMEPEDTDKNDAEDIRNREVGAAEPKPRGPVRKEPKEPTLNLGPEVHHGHVLIRVAPNKGIRQLRDFQERLRQLENLRVLWTGGSSDGGPTIAVSLQKPMLLMRALNEFPIVESVSSEDEKIVVVLKANVMN